MSNKFISKIINDDCQEESLPTTRRKQIGYLVKKHFWQLVLFSVFLFLSIIPALFLIYLFSYNIMIAEYTNQIFFYHIYIGLSLIVTNIPIFVVLSGVSYSIRSMIHNNYYNFDNFRSGIKDNWLVFIRISLLLSISELIAIFDFSYYSLMSTLPTILNYLIISLGLIQLTILIISVIYMCYQQVTYKLSFKDLIRNSFKLTFVNLFLNFIIIIPIIITIILAAILPLGLSIVALSILGLFFSFFLLIIFEYLTFIFDKYVNNTMFKNIYKKGLNNR